MIACDVSPVAMFKQECTFGLILFSSLNNFPALFVFFLPHTSDDDDEGEGGASTLLLALIDQPWVCSLLPTLLHYFPVVNHDHHLEDDHHEDL